MGEWLMLQGRPNLKSIAHLPEAEEMIRSMLAWQQGKRPSVRAVMQQPFWWSPARRLAFLVHLSDRMEMEDREVSTCMVTPPGLHQGDSRLGCSQTTCMEQW